MTDIPVTKNGLINWLIGFLFVSLVGIIVWLGLGIMVKLDDLSLEVRSLSEGMVKIETQMEQVAKDQEMTRLKAEKNATEIMELKSNQSRILEWKKQQEK